MTENWTLKIDIDCAGDDETQNVVDDLIWEGFKVIADGLLQLGVSLDGVSCVDPNGSDMSKGYEALYGNKEEVIDMDNLPKNMVANEKGCMLERVRYTTAARASSVDDKYEWDITEDGFRFKKGDIVYNYYDCEWVKVIEDPLGSDHFNPEYYRGWFDVENIENGRKTSLNSVRVSANKPSWAK